MRAALAGLIVALAVGLHQAARRGRGEAVAHRLLGAAAPPAPTAVGAGVARGRAAARTWWRGRRGPDEEMRAVLELLDALAPALRAGLPPSSALRCIQAPGTGPGRDIVTELVAAADLGERLAPIWVARAERAASPELALVGRAWCLSESLGAPLADSVALGAELVRQRLGRQRRLAIALAGPRATTWVLTLLPLAGPGVALLLGVSPTQLYGNAAAALSVGAGVLLIAVGRRWCARMVRSLTVARPAPEPP